MQEIGRIAETIFLLEYVSIQSIQDEITSLFCITKFRCVGRFCFQYREVISSQVLNDEATQRRVHLVLTHHETRHPLARAIAHGNQGEIRQHYRVGMEDQLGALGFVVNVMVLWNSLCTQAALELIEAMGDGVLEADVARLSPLKRERPARCRFASKK